MRKVLWLVAALFTVSVIAHYFSDQVAIDTCLEQAGSFHYDSDFCSYKQDYQGEQNFILNHKALLLLWSLSILGLIGSVLIKLKPARKTNKKLLMIDNYDSFTYNLVQYFSELGLEVLVKRNDELSVDEIEALNPDYICISPGPCSPNEAGVSLKAIEQLASSYPILGICLGHQAMAQVLGGKVIRAKQVVHGKTSQIFHNGKGVFRNLPSPFEATRYHSLVVERETLPQEFEVTAWTEDEAGELEYIMGIRHKTLALEGVQFHPESILSEHGHQLLKNFL